MRGPVTSRITWRSPTRLLSTATWIVANNYGTNEPLVGGGVLQPEAHVRPGTWRRTAGSRFGLPVVFAPFVRLAVPLTHALTRISRRTRCGARG